MNKKILLLGKVRNRYSKTQFWTIYYEPYFLYNALDMERTFSTLKLLKNYLRSTMNEERLNGLAMAKINKSVKITAEEVIKVFS